MPELQTIKLWCAWNNWPNEQVRQMIDGRGRV